MKYTIFAYPKSQKDGLTYTSIHISLLMPNLLRTASLNTIALSRKSDLEIYLSLFMDYSQGVAGVSLRSSLLCLLSRIASLNLLSTLVSVFIEYYYQKVKIHTLKHSIWKVTNSKNIGVMYHMMVHLQAYDWFDPYFFSTIVGLRTILSWETGKIEGEAFRISLPLILGDGGCYKMGQLFGGGASLNTFWWRFMVSLRSSCKESWDLALYQAMVRSSSENKEPKLVSSNASTLLPQKVTMFLDFLPIISRPIFSYISPYLIVTKSKLSLRAKKRLSVVTKTSRRMELFQISACVIVTEKASEDCMC